MVIDQSGGLHVCIDNRASQKFKSPLFNPNYALE
jgi:hypothetical protein